jgi:phosphomannomutase
VSSIDNLLREGRIIAKSNVDLTPEVICMLGAVHGTYMENNGIIVIGRDYRRDCRMLKRAFTAGCMSTGIDILDLHVAPLPLVQFCIRRFGASGGVYFTSGHAKYEEVSIRFFNSLGIELPKNEMDRISTIWEKKGIKRVSPARVGKLSTIPHTQSVYEKAVPGFIDKNLIKGKKMVLDCSYGPAGEISPTLLSNLDVEIISLNTFVPNDVQTTIPNYHSIKQISNIVKASSADLGVVMDVDGSRAIFLDETGSIADFDQILAVFLLYEKSIKNNRQSPIILSQSHSSIIPKICAEYDQQYFSVDNTPGVISEKIKEQRAIFGASDTGKFYFSEYGPFSDANLTALKVLEIMGETGMPLSKLLRETPKTIKGFKDITINSEIISELFNIFSKKNSGFTVIDALYGIKIIFEPGSWVLLKPSLHRDAIELSAESSSKETESEMIKEVERILLAEEEKLTGVTGAKKR